MIDIVVFALVAAAVLAAYMSSFKALALAKAKIAAVALANEKMEELRNMPYKSLATKNGVVYPPGEIDDYQVITRNGIEFSVNIKIVYVDDPFDSIAGGEPNDIYPYDYKKAEVTVSKLGRSGHLAQLTSSIAAKAAETPGDSGIIRLCVIDYASMPIPGAIITIENPYTAPPVNISAETQNDGCITIYNLPEDRHNRYHLTATKDGFSTDMTIPRTAQNPNALIPDVDVLIQQITSQTLTIDRVSTLTISVIDENGNPVPNMLVHLEGTKRIYFNPSTYKYSSDHITDTNGNILLNSMEFDSYRITIPGNTILMTSPYQPINLQPNTTLPVVVMIGNSSLPSIYSCEPTQGNTGSLVSLKIIGTNFANATVRLVNSGGQEIVGNNIEIIESKEINADFDLTGVTTGAWDVVVQNGSGVTRQTNGFTVLQ